MAAAVVGLSDRSAGLQQHRPGGRVRGLEYNNVTRCVWRMVDGTLVSEQFSRSNTVECPQLGVPPDLRVAARLT